MQVNEWFVAISVLLVLLWKVDFIATLLNLKSLGTPMPEEFREMLSEEEGERSRDYTRARANIGIGESFFSLVLLLAFWWLGGFGWLDEVVRGLGWGDIPHGIVYIATLALALQIAGLPFDVYDTFVLEERFGFNRTTPGTFVADFFKGLILSAVLGLPLLAALLWLFAQVPFAWLWGWGLVTVFSLALAYVAPTWILPLFNKFTPLEEGELKDEIHAMADKCAFPLREVCVMDGSKRSSKANAFFTGWGKNKRIALFDTLVENHTTPELVGVLAHEIGHFKKRHIVKSIVLSIVTTGMLFFLLGLMLENRGLFDAFGVGETSVYVSLVLFGILIQPVNDLLSVLGNVLSRKHEFEADNFAADATGEPGALAEALRKLSRDNLSNLTPHPFYVFLNYSHPPVVDRIRRLKGVAA